MAVGAAGGPHAAAAAHALAGAAAQLAAAVAGPDRGRPRGHGAGRPAPHAGPHRVVRAGGGLWLGHAGHCARCLSHRIGRRQPPGGAGCLVPDRLPPGHDLGRRGRAVDCGTRRGGARCGPGGGPRGGPGAGPGCGRLPERRLAGGLSGHGRVDGRGRGHGAVLARAGARGAAARQKCRRMDQGRRGRSVCRFSGPLRLAGRADSGADCRVPHQRRGDGHHGQPVLCGHGLSPRTRWRP